MPAKLLTVQEAFEAVQEGHSMNKLVSMLKQTHDKIEDKSAFFDEFIRFLKYSMVVFQRERVVERTLEMVAKFAVTFVIDDNNSEDEGDDEENDDESNFFHLLFSFLLKSHGVCDKAVRFRTCQLINKLLNNLGDDAQISDSLFEELHSQMLIRMKDKVPAVRVQAIYAVNRLQDPTDENCPVIDAYLYMMEKDSSLEVRRVVLANLAVSRKTLPAILERTRDAKDQIRKLAYSVIANKVHIKSLTMSQRAQLLKNGLGDRSEMVREACESQLLQAWLKIFQGNVLDLLYSLDVETYTETAQKALRHLFDKASPRQLVEDFDLLNERLLIEVDELTVEKALYWRSLVQHVQSLGVKAEDLLEKLLPNLSHFCEYLRTYLMSLSVPGQVEEMEETLWREFVSQQLLGLAQLFDFTDEVGRKNLEALVRQMLARPSMGVALVKPLLSLYLKLHAADKEGVVEEVVEMISDIREPISTCLEEPCSSEERRRLEMKLASVRVKLNVVREDLEECVSKQEFGQAADLKEEYKELEAEKQQLVKDLEPIVQEIRTEKNDSQTLIKCLTIACELLEGLNLKEVSPAIRSLVDLQVLPSIQNEDPAVRRAAAQCLGLVALINVDYAKQHLLLLVQISQVDHETVQVTVLRAIFDLLLVFGFHTFRTSGEEGGEVAGDDGGSSHTAEAEGLEEVKEPAESGEGGGSGGTTDGILSILTSLLDSESAEVRSVAVEGMCKLMLCGRLLSPKLLSRMVLLWYNPVTEDDTRLRHCLATFFPAYSFASRSNQECVGEAFMPTLQTLFKAPVSSPLAKVNQGNVATLLAELTRASNLKDKDNLQGSSSLHDSLALKICNEILTRVSVAGARVLCKVLAGLQLSGDNQTLVTDLQALSIQLLESVKERICRRYLEKFSQTVNSLAAGTAAADDKENDGRVGADSQGGNSSGSEAEGRADDDDDAAGKGRDLATQIFSELPNGPLRLPVIEESAENETGKRVTTGLRKNTATAASAKSTKKKASSNPASVKKERANFHTAPGPKTPKVNLTSMLSDSSESSDDSGDEDFMPVPHRKRPAMPLSSLNITSEDS